MIPDLSATTPAGRVNTPPEPHVDADEGQMPRYNRSDFPGPANHRMLPSSLKRYAWLSIAAALATILLKGWAWWITGSVGLLSDALESFVNLAGAMMALAMLTLAALPADQNPAHGHGKAEYFSSAFEGFLILVAAVAIAYTAIERLLNPQPLEAVGIGLAVS
ncbi:MAG: cation diffusion facilitator family transporter, partial [Thiobacillus sp.]|nr:cation diffusion facilitator family transporter [Thiobacillus sp.]